MPTKKNSTILVSIPRSFPHHLAFGVLLLAFAALACMPARALEPQSLEAQASPVHVHLTQRAIWPDSDATASVAATAASQVPPARSAATPIAARAELPQAVASGAMAPLHYVRPGNVVEYRAVYTNKGSEPVRVQAMLPVPAHTEYLARSAHSSGQFVAKAAAANGNFAAEPLYQATASTTSDGTATGARLPVPYADYRAVQWQLGTLAPGQSAWVALRVRITR